MIDVGYSGVIGADRITHGEDLYGTFPDENGSGDTYGPLAYYSYVPFELAFPWSGMWDDLPAAHAAAIAFDLATMLALFFVGRRLLPGPGGNRLGLVLAYGWAAYPYTTFVLNSNANDSLVALLVTLAFLVISSPRARGAALALAAAAKFAPLALVPLWAAHDRRRARDAIAFALAFGAVTVLLWLPVLPDGGVRELWDRTVGFQLGRDSPFSIWGLEDLGWAQDIVKALAVALAVGVAMHPRIKTPLVVAALGAATLVGLQLALSTGSTCTSCGGCRSCWWRCWRWVTSGRARHHDLLEPTREAVVAYVDDASHHPRVLVGRLELDRHLGHKALDDLLPLHADHAAPRAGHADVRDEGGPLREHTSVGGRDVRVGAEHREHAAVEVPPHRHLLARRLCVEVDHHHVGLVAQPGKHTVDDVER